MDQAPRDSHVGNNYKLMLKICQRYAKDMQGVIMRLQIQDNYLKQKYAKCMPYGKGNYLKLWPSTLWQ